MLHQLSGTITFVDEANGLRGYYQHNGYTFRKQDYVWGEIFKDGERVCEVSGNYMGYLDFDELRYWDGRDTDLISYPLAGECKDEMLPSQASLRTDGRFLMSYTVEEAQAEKERLENL